MNVDEGRRILKEVQREFMECVDARAIAQKARMEKIIPEAVEIQINESKSLDAAKEVLLKHLHNQVTLEGLRHFCSIMIESEGYQLMQMFGNELQAKLKKVMPRPGSSQVSSAAASDVEMEGSIEQQKDSNSAASVVPDTGVAMPLPPPPPPDIADIVEALDHQLDAKWRHFGTFLHVDYQTMEAIKLDNGGRPDDCMLELLCRWTSNQAGTGTLPRTWQTVMEAVRKTGFPVIAKNLAHKHGLMQLSKAREKRSPEDYADHEWKRQKDSDTADRKAVVSCVHPAYDVEEADRFFLKKAIMTLVKGEKLDTLKLKKDLYRHTYYSVERILEANAQHFKHMVRAAKLATEDEEDERRLSTACTVEELLDKLCIKTKLESTELLAEIVFSLPEEPRALAMSLLKRYEGYLEVYDNLVPAQDSLQMQLAVPEGTKPQVPVEVTVTKCLTEFMNKDCKEIVNLLFHNSYKIPRIKIMVADIQPGSTTVVFLIDKAFTENIIHSSRKVSPLWAFQELRVTRVRFGDFELNVVQLLTQHFKEALRSGLTGSMDFVGATKALPYQVYALVDPDISEKLVIRTVYGKIAQSYSEQEDLVSGTADSEDSEGVETTSEMEEDTLPPKVEEEAELDDEGKIKETTDSGELRSRVQELEEELKNSEGKRMDLTHENMALVNHLKVCQKQKDHTEQEIASLKKRLFSMLSSQGGADKDSALTAPSDVRSKRIPHRWWLKVSAGSYDSSLLPSSLTEQAEGGREMEGEVVFRRGTKSNLLKAVSGSEWMYRRGALERGRRSATAKLHQHQFTHYHRRWLADNVQKEEEETCKQWLLQSSPDVGSVRKGEEQGLMSKVYKQALRDYQEKIAGVLIVENIISDLSEPYLTEVEYLQVKSKLGNKAQVDELFRILLTKGNRHFKVFCHVLEDNGYQHWAQQLRSSTDGAETEDLPQGDAILSENVSDHRRHLMLFRRHISRRAAGKGRAVLEGVGLGTPTIESCFINNPVNEEEVVQAGLTKWCWGAGFQPPTWGVLIEAMEYANIAQQAIDALRRALS